MNGQVNDTVNNVSQPNSITNWLSNLSFYEIALVVITIALFIAICMLIRISKKRKFLESQQKTVHEKTQTQKPATPPDEVSVAIAMALHLHQNELHDAENNVLTINRVAKLYSPWSSKIYGLRRCPR